MNRLLRPGESIPPGVQTEVVPVKTIRQVRNEHQVEEIGLLKADTEGFDLEVLHGAERMLSKGKVFLVMVEVRFSEADKGHTPYISVREFLRGFELWFL